VCLNCTSQREFNRGVAQVGGEAEDEEAAAEERPSKSARKRAAHAAQDLGEQLIELNDAQLAALALPPTLEEAVRAARRIRTRAGLARQRQYIGKLMRALDLAPIRAALTARSAADARAAERFKRVESWRARLIAEGSAALAELARWHPDLDRAAWAQRISAAQREQARTGAGGAAARELFRALRALLDTMP
jgi:ribosome-associated protein